MKKTLLLVLFLLLVSVVHATNPTITVTLNSSQSYNTTLENLTATINATGGSGTINYAHDWRLNGSSIAVLNMNFDVNDSAGVNKTRDYSIYQNNGTSYNGTFWNATGGLNGTGAYQFDGINDFILLPNSTILQPNNSITLASWIKIKGTTGNWQTIISRDYWSNGSWSTPWQSYILQTNATNTVFVVITTSTNRYYNYSTSPISTGVWHHVVGTYDGTSLKIYIDGSLNNSMPATGTINYTGNKNITIGSRSVYSPSEFFNGTIDNVQIYNRALSAQEILALYNNQTNLLVSQETAAGQKWSACITPNDGASDGTTVCSSNLTISTPPVMISALILPTTPYKNDTLVGFCNATDVDGNNVAYSTRWYKNGIMYENTQLNTISGGHEQSCAITSDGTAYCWGNNTYGQLGIGNTTMLYNPTPINMTGIGAAKWKSISIGGYHACGILTNGTGYCWGDNAGGQLGTGNITQMLNPTLINVTGMTVNTWKSIKAGNLDTCGILTNGSAYCWGYNANGQLGIGNQVNSYLPTQVITTGFSTSTWDYISTGWYHTCGILTNGTGYCWGWNEFGQVGIGNYTNMSSPTPISSNGMTINTWKKIDAGVYTTCGILTSGSAYCWGRNDYGMLGTGNATNMTTPAAVNTTGMTTNTWIDIGTGILHSCGILSNKTAYCWGWNGNGQLGNGSTGIQKTLPTQVVAAGGSVNWDAITLGSYYTCGILGTNPAYCWGQNNFGQLGIGNITEMTSPKPINLSSSLIPLLNSDRYTQGVYKNIENISYAITQNDNWIMECTSNDYGGYSSPVNSSTVTIQNFVPTITQLTANSTIGSNTTYENLTAFTTTTDGDNDDTHVCYDWRVNGTSMAIINMNFDVDNSGGSGKTRDYSSYQNNGTVTGAVWSKTSGFNGTGGYYFDGADTTYISPTSVNLNGKSFSLEVWAKRSATGTDFDIIFGGGSASTNNGLHFGFRDTNVLTFGFFGNDLNTSAAYTDTTNWHHWVGTYDTTTNNRTVYYDGQQVASGISSSDYLSTFTKIGNGFSTAYGFRGYIDNVKVYNYSLSPEQVRANFQNKTSTVVSQELQVADKWSICAIPNDGYSDGSIVCLQNITILQHYPTTTSLVLNSTLGRNTTAEDITAYATVNDQFHSTNICYDWRMNGTSIAILNMNFDVNNSAGTGKTRDYTTYSNNGTVTSATWNITNGADQSAYYDFDGINDVITSYPPNISASDGFSVAAWVKIKNIADNDNIINRWDENSNNRVWNIVNQANQIRFDTSSDGTWQAGNSVGYSNTAYSNVWVFVVGVYDITNNSLYINGIKINSTDRTSDGLKASNIPLRIGYSPLTFATSNVYFTGSVDSVMIFNRSLSSQEILALYNNQTNKIVKQELLSSQNWSVCITPNDGIIDGSTTCSSNITIKPNYVPTATILINSSNGSNKTNANITAYATVTDTENDDTTSIYDWRISNQSIAVLNMNFDLEDSAGTNGVRDYTTYSNNGTVNGATWNATSGLNGTGAYQFDGINDHINISNSASLNPDEITITAWIYISSSTTNSGNIVNKGGNSGYRLRIENNTRKLVFFDRGATNYIGSTSAVPLNQWTFVAATGDASGIKTYLNGVFEKINATPYGAPVTTDSLTIGGWIGTGELFNGSIDDVRIYDRALSAEQILALYNNKTNLIVSQELHKSESWSACITPNDGNADGSTYCSNSLIMLNDAPSAVTAINSTYNYNSTYENMTAYTNTSDPENDNVKIAYDWRVNGTSIAVLNMNFDVNNSAGTGKTRDYTSYQNNGTIVGQDGLRTRFVMNASANTYMYEDITSTTDYTLVSGSCLEYDIMWTSPNDYISFDYTTTNGTTLRGSGAVDQNGLDGAWGNTSSYSYLKWYHRKISIPAGHTGTTISYYDLACERDITGTYTGYFRNITITDCANTIRKTIYAGGSYTHASHLKFNATTTDFGSDYETSTWSPTGGWNGTGAYNFDGANDVIYIPNSPSVNISGNQLTLSAWVYPRDTTTDYDRVIEKSWTSSTSPWLLYNINRDGNNQNYSICVTNTTAISQCAKTTSPISLNTWTLLTGTYNGTHLAIYVNGRLNATNTHTGNVYTNTQPVTIGSSSINTEFFNGSIDDVRIYNRALSSQEIQAIYSNKSNILVSQELVKGQNVSVCVTPNDVYADGNTTCSNNMTINQGPETLQIDLTPNPAYTYDSIIGWCNGTTDLNSTVNYQYEFYKNGGYYAGGNLAAQQLATYTNIIIGPYTVKKYEQWLFSCRAMSNGFAGPWMNSSTITINNSIPYLSNFIINTTNNQNTTVENITAYYSTTDEDSDNVSYAYDWRMNNQSIAVLNMNFDVNNSAGTGKTRDYSTNNNIATAINAIWNATAGYGGTGAYKFDGYNDYIQVKDTGALSPSGNITIMAWINVAAFSSYGRIVSKKYQADGTWVDPYLSYTLSATDASIIQPYFSLTTGGTFSGVRINSTLSTGQWYHITGTYDGSYARIYLNGKPENSIAKTGSISYVGYPNVSIGSLGPYLTTGSFNGTIDDVRIYDRKLSDEEILAIYNNKSNILVSKELDEGQNYSICITPNDKDTDGATVCSNTISVNDVIIRQSDITPDSPGTGSTLQAFCNATQASGENISYDVKWFKNNELYEELIPESLSTGNDVTCGIAKNGTGYCWGNGNYGQLGIGNTTTMTNPTQINTTGMTTKTWKQISVGNYHTCGILTNGTAYCWGDNNYGNLGNGSQGGSKYSPTQVNMVGFTTIDWKMIFAGHGNTCGILTNSTGYCWGYNQYGKLGIGNITNMSIPTAVNTTGMTTNTWKQINTKANNACGILTNGTAYCWGYNGQGQIGNGNQTDMWTPTAVNTTGMTTNTWKQINSGYSFTCGILTNGTGYCWGYNANGQLGIGNTAMKTTPVQINTTGMTTNTWKQISTGNGYSCGILTNGTGYCWGYNEYRTLGIGNVTNTTLPTLIDTSNQLLTIWKTITTGMTHTCGILTNGTAYCWGTNSYSNAYGQLGTGNITNTTKPFQVNLTSIIIPTYTQGVLSNVANISSGLDRNDNWIVECRANDLDTYSNPINSSQVTIKSCAPLGTKDETIYMEDLCVISTIINFNRFILTLNGTNSGYVNITGKIYNFSTVVAKGNTTVYGNLG